MIVITIKKKEKKTRVRITGRFRRVGLNLNNLAKVVLLIFNNLGHLNRGLSLAPLIVLCNYKQVSSGLMVHTLVEQKFC